MENHIENEQESCCRTYADRQFIWHILFHSGELKLQCTSCNLRFSHNQAFENHVLKCDGACSDHGGPYKKKRAFLETIQQNYLGLMPAGVQTAFSIFANEKRGTRIELNKMSAEDKQQYLDIADAEDQQFEKAIRNYRELVFGVHGEVIKVNQITSFRLHTRISQSI